jgi:SAM-dependent methyltransferase
LTNGQSPGKGPAARLLNIGCGAAFHKEWVNIDVASALPEVIAHDLRRPLPFADATFDGAYGSHVLEHFEPEAGIRLLRECLRVLKPDGTLRIVVPDLETIAKLYLQALEGAVAGDPQAAFRHQWAMLELYDQTVRSTSGGRMAACLNSLAEEQAKIVRSRIGEEALPSHGEPPASEPGSGIRMSHRLRARWTALRRAAAAASTFLFLGREGVAALREGLFRRSGEVHQWMYDRFSLRQAMEEAGFRAVRVCAVDDSRIPEFRRFALEMRKGRPRKPDSLYVEGIKPRTE